MVKTETQGNFGSFTDLDYSSDSPNMVIRQSAIIMSAPRIPDNPEQQFAATILRDSTFDLIDQIEQGLYIDALSSNRFTTDEMKQAEKRINPQVSQTRASEAFGIARTIFGLMPRTLIFRFGHYNIPYSLRGSLKPPETLQEHKIKIASVKRGVRSYAIEADDITFIKYATAFMKVGSLIEVKTIPAEHEQKEETEYRSRRILDLPSSSEQKTIFE